VIVGRFITAPGKAIFFLLPMLPSFRTYVVTMFPSIFNTLVLIPPSANKIFLSTAVDHGKSLYEHAIL
jgi:hypothetical protein